MSDKGAEGPRPADRVPPPPPRQADMALIGYLERANRSAPAEQRPPRRRWFHGARRDDRTD